MMSAWGCRVSDRTVAKNVTRLVVAFAACVTVVLSLSPPIAEAAGTPVIVAEQTPVPTVMPPGAASESLDGTTAYLANIKMEVNVNNYGSGPTKQPLTVVDTVGAGLEVSTTIQSEWLLNQANSGGEHPCLVSASTVTCQIPPGLGVAPENGTSGHFRILIPVNVTGAAGSQASNEVVVSEGVTQVSASHATVQIDARRAPFGLSDTEGVVGRVFDRNGDTPEAGAHPYSAIARVQIPTYSAPAGTSHPVESLRSLNLEFPPGLVINPRGAATLCQPSRLEAASAQCPASSQIGYVWATREQTREVEPLYVLDPPTGVPAELGFSVFGIGVRARGGLGQDFRLTASSINLLSKLEVSEVEVEIWGNPSDGTHAGSGEEEKQGGLAEGEKSFVPIASSRGPILTMPSACGPMPLTASVESWLGSRGERTVDFQDRSDQSIQVAGCANVPFAPSVSVSPTSHRASSSTGLGIEVTLPQNNSTAGLATATLKEVNLRLPVGVAINPAAADGLGACSQAEIGIGNDRLATCPGGSKVGSVEIQTPLLQSPLKGSIYLAEQDNNPFDTLIALYLVVEGEGIVIKLPGQVHADPTTGQLTANFDNNPQLPFESLKVTFAEGPRATLTTPSACGTYATRTELTSWASSTPVVIDTPFTIDQGCNSGGFSPKLEAGTTNPVAGSYSPFTMRVTRQDGEANISRISATLPKGLLAKLAGVGLCPDAPAATGNCPASSQIGSAIAATGTGSQPLYIPQPGKTPTAVYLAGPYDGAPYSLVVKVPAQAGPFNLGTIAVRVALQVDPFTTQVTASSGTLPQILEGIPVAYRDVRVEASRDNFIINPTNCEPMQVISQITAASGAVANPSSRFQVAGCSSLAFKPALKLSLTGATKRTGHPALKAVVTYPKEGAYANIARAQVNLPSSEFIDQGNLNKTCTKPVLLAGNCPKSTVYGKAKAWTPLLDRPLQGNVYLVGGFGYKLPALVAELNGQIRVLLKGKVDTGPNKGIRNTFEAVPDAPVSRFVLEMKGGKKYGLFENSESLCKKPQHAILRFNGQNGAVEQTKPKIAVKCGKAKRKAS